MKITIGQNAERGEIEDALAPVIQDLIEARLLNNEEREAVSECLLRAFLRAKWNTPGLQTGEFFHYRFSAIVDFQNGVFELYRKIPDQPTPE